MAEVVKCIKVLSLRSQISNVKLLESLYGV